MTDLDPRMTAGIALLGRTGAKDVQIRYSDDEFPTVWFIVTRYERSRNNYYDTASAMDPTTAVMRMCERMIDGGQCNHCHLPTIFIPDSDDQLLKQMGCVYAWDPELKTFRRSCEGDR